MASASQELTNFLKNTDVSQAEKLQQAKILLNERQANADYYEIVSATLTDRYESPIGCLLVNYQGSPEEDEILTLLIQKGANPCGLGMTMELTLMGQTFFQDISAIHYVCYTGNAHLVRCMLQASGGKNITFALTESKELTPLMLAAAQGHGEIVRLLLEQGEKKFHRDTKGRTAISFAGSHPQIMALLANAA